MSTNSIFIAHDEDTTDEISTTYTEIYDTIPGDKRTTPLPNWRKSYHVEWRWRFLKIPPGILDKKRRFVAEISYINYDSKKRVYYNNRGERVYREVPSALDRYVTEEFYSYE